MKCNLGQLISVPWLESLRNAFGKTISLTFYVKVFLWLPLRLYLARVEQVSFRHRHQKDDSEVMDVKAALADISKGSYLLLSMSRCW